MSRPRNNWRGYLFVAPATMYLAIFALVPMVMAAYLSLQDWYLLRQEPPRFVGFDNYVDLLRDPFFRNAIWNTVYFAALSVPLGVASSLAVAVLVNQRLRGIAVFRTLFYLPAVTSGVAVSMVWIWVFLPNDGLINYVIHQGAERSWLLRQVFGANFNVDFLNTPALAMPCLVVMSMWQGLGPRMVIFLAGLQGIPDHLYESASLDGAGGWAKFRHVTLPLLMPTTFFVVVTSTIASFQLFTQVYVMTRGGPQRATDVVVYHIFKEAWHRFHIGRASAMSYVLFGLIVLISAVQFFLMRRQVREAGEAW